MPQGPPLPAVVLARAVVADVEAQAAEPAAVVPVDLVQLRSPQFLVAARLRLAEVALLAAVVKLAVAVVDVPAVAAVLLPLHQSIVALRCRASRSSTCCWLPV